MLATDRILYINGLKQTEKQTKETFYQKLAKLIYKQMETKTGIFSTKTNWRD